MLLNKFGYKKLWHKQNAEYNRVGFFIVCEVTSKISQVTMLEKDDIKYYTLKELWKTYSTSKERYFLNKKLKKISNQ